MSDKPSKPVKFDEKSSSRHGIARFGNSLSETITPILDAISAAGWELAFHPISGIHDGWGSMSKYGRSGIVRGAGGG